MKAVVVITQLYTFVMYTSQTAHLKLVNFIVGKLYLNKADFKNVCIYSFSKYLLSIYYVHQSLHQIFQLDYLGPTCM